MQIEVIILTLDLTKIVKLRLHVKDCSVLKFKCLKVVKFKWLQIKLEKSEQLHSMLLQSTKNGVALQFYIKDTLTKGVSPTFHEK